MNDRLKKKFRAFTLIELMIVVAIISIIAAFIIPAFIAGRERARKSRSSQGQDAGAERRSSMPVSPVLSTIRAEKASMALPTIDEADIAMKLTARHDRVGMDVYTRFDVACKERLSLTGPGEGKEPFQLDLEFPLNTTEARDVSLKFNDGARQWEPEGVVYDQKGIFWSGMVPGKKPVSAEVSFIAQGRERFEYNLPRAERLKSVKLTLEMEGITGCQLPDQALQPTTIGGSNLEWKFNNLVTNRPVIIDLPGAQSPMGRLMFLCKLVGLAVLLFGAGFWYLVELYEAGRLSGFRWGHFLLLALTYSLFFVIFAVLGFRGQVTVWMAMAVAALLSMPLLVLHVARIIDLGFALTRTLPLALFTLGLVINGVYGGVQREYVFIAAAFLVVAFITFTYRSFSLKRDACLAAREAKLQGLIEKIAASAEEARRASVEASMLLGESTVSSLQRIKAPVEKAQKSVDAQLEAYDYLQLRVADMLSNPDPSSRSEAATNHFSTAGQLEHRLPLVTRELRESLTFLKEALVDKESPAGTDERPGSGPGEELHCTACGYGSGDYPYCPQCGTARAKLITCGGCGEITSLPLQIVVAKDLPDNLHCFKCGRMVNVSKNT